MNRLDLAVYVRAGTHDGRAAPGPERAFSQTGEHHYNLSRERIRQLQEQAIGKIRKQMREF